MKSEEIARLAGVSRSTVSRVINNYPNVPEETRERVMKVIRSIITSQQLSQGSCRQGHQYPGSFSVYRTRYQKNQQNLWQQLFCALVDAVVDTATTWAIMSLSIPFMIPPIAAESSRPFSRSALTWHYRRYRKKQGDTGHHPELSYPLAIVDYDPDEIRSIMREDGSISVINSNDEKGINACVDYLVSLDIRRLV
jgi:LacI family transcriptional regulator